MSLSRQQFTLLGIFALFLGPVLLVMLMRSPWWQYQPEGLKNQGYLVQPPIHLALSETQSMNGKWLMLYVLDQPCDQKCIENITVLRQTHRAAGRNGEHLAIVLLTRTPPDSELKSRLVSIYPEFNIVTDTANTAITTLAGINAGIDTNGMDSIDFHSYILDPMLNVILAYGANSNPGDMHKDLKRLLKWSDQEGR